MLSIQRRSTVTKLAAPRCRNDKPHRTYTKLIKIHYYLLFDGLGCGKWYCKQSAVLSGTATNNVTTQCASMSVYSLLTVETAHQIYAYREIMKLYKDSGRND